MAFKDTLTVVPELAVGLKLPHQGFSEFCPAPICRESPAGPSSSILSDRVNSVAARGVLPLAAAVEPSLDAVDLAPRPLSTARSSAAVGLAEAV